MKFRKLISLLLCIMIITSAVPFMLPITATAETSVTTAAETPKYNTVSFDEILTFDNQTVGTAISDTNLATMVSDTTLLKVSKRNSSAIYSKPEGDSDNALYLQSSSKGGITRRPY